MMAETNHPDREPRPLRFALYGRVSTEDHQDPVSSLAWQRRRAEDLVSGHGQIVKVYFDRGVSRSLPWKRRPEASLLLSDLKRPDREFDAVVIGEPQRAFSGAQFGLTFPKLTHYGVSLWVPEVGGPIDPGSEMHEMVMTLYGGMSKAERTRTMTRVRSAMESQAVVEGRFLGGRPPYGYRLVDAGPHPNPSKAADGRRVQRLEADPVTAPVVRRLFDEYVHGGLGLRALAQRLTDDGVPCPSAYDPGRNSHRVGNGGAWSRSAVRAILRNPRYTGHQVWGRYRGHERLVDPEDVEHGYAKKSRPQRADEWLWSTEVVHDVIIPMELFEAAKAQQQEGRRRTTDRRITKAKRVYALRGKVWCATCGRRMEADWRDGQPRYRCRLSGPDYARNPSIDESHPQTASLREPRVLPAIDTWLAGLFDPAHVDSTIEALVGAATDPDPATAARLDNVRHRIAETEKKLDRYRGLLDAGAEQSLVVGWIADAIADRDAARRELSEWSTEPTFTEHAVREAVEALTVAAGRFAEVMAAADPVEREAFYDALGIRVYFTPGADEVEVTLAPAGGEKRVGGGTGPNTPLVRVRVPLAA